jgi:N utilization substance protein A
MTDFGRVAAGTAKQVVVQRIKEAEKELTIKAFEGKQDELLVGTLAREDAKTYYVDLGRSFGLLPKDEIIPGEKLEMGSSVKAYVSKLEIGSKGVFILLSRCHYGFLKRLLELEIPEINDGEVILYSVAREAGSRSKIAVYSENPNLEPVGCVIGANGSRINRVLKQINGEKIDVVLYDKDPIKFIQNALSPAKDVKVIITDPKKKEAIALLNRDNLSLAIGKKGQNVRLASRLTHYRIDVKNIEDVDVEELEKKYANKISEIEDTNIEDTNDSNTENEEIITEEIVNDEVVNEESNEVVEVNHEESTNA